MNVRPAAFVLFFISFLLQPRLSYSSVVCVARLENQIINPITAQFMIDAISHAEALSHECVIIELDTPGGLLESTRDVVRKELNAKIPVVVYVSPRGARAASAGVFIAMAGDIAVMAPGTNIGAAHPVTPGGTRDECGRMFEFERKKEEKSADKKEKAEPQPREERRGGADEVMGEKIMNDTVAWIRAVALYRGRNADWAARAVRESVSATADEAVREKIVDMECSSLEDLLEKLDGREVQTPAGLKKLKTKGATVVSREMNTRQRVLSAISNPQIAYLLFILGIIGLFIEFRTPGVGFPGAAGAICLILAFFAFRILPVNYAGVALIILAAAMLIAETMVVSYGLLLLGGLVCLVLGSLMLIESQEGFMNISLSIVIPVAVALGIIFAFLTALVVKSQVRRPHSGIEGLIGLVGVSEGRIDPEGTVMVHGEIWAAESKEAIGKGEKVVVVGAEGLKLFVERERGRAKS